MGYMERFQVDGQWMAEDELAPFVSQVKEAAEKVEEKTDLTVTVFEIETAIAFSISEKSSVIMSFWKPEWVGFLMRQM